MGISSRRLESQETKWAGILNIFISDIKFHISFKILIFERSDKDKLACEGNSTREICRTKRGM